MKYTAVYEPVDEGGYVAWLEEMRGVQTQGETYRPKPSRICSMRFNLSLEYLRDKAIGSGFKPAGLTRRGGRLNPKTVISRTC